MKNIYRIFIALITVGTLVACDYDSDFVEPSYATLASEREVAVLNTGSESVEVTLYTGNITGSDRTFTIYVDESSTLDPSTYSLPQTVTVPGNSNEVSFTIEVTGEGIKNQGDVLVLGIQEDATFSTGNLLSIAVTKICPFDINTFVGTFSASEVFTAGSNAGYSFGAANGLDLQVELTPNPDDESGNSLVLTNSEGFYAFIPDGTVLTFDPADGSLSLPADLTVFGYAHTVESSRVDNCAETLRFTGPLAAFGEYTVTLAKQ